MDNGFILRCAVRRPSIQLCDTVVITARRMMVMPRG